MSNLQKELTKISDAKYASFQCKLTSVIDLYLFFTRTLHLFVLGNSKSLHFLLYYSRGLKL